jgi:hypothetical protein
MSSLSSTSTDAEVYAAYDDNASYAEDVSAAKARAFTTAVRILLRRLPAEAGTREGNVRFSPETLRKELEEARDWLIANGSAASGSGAPVAVRAGFNNYRRSAGGRCG